MIHIEVRPTMLGVWVNGKKETLKQGFLTITDPELEKAVLERLKIGEPDIVIVGELVEDYHQEDKTKKVKGVKVTPETE